MENKFTIEIFLNTTVVHRLTHPVSAGAPAVREQAKEIYCILLNIQHCPDKDMQKKVMKPIEEDIHLQNEVDIIRFALSKVWSNIVR